jgi:DNA-binding MarR family transcriptional regulator/GNAT superfamily N-acetyltransferase
MTISDYGQKMSSAEQIAGVRSFNRTVTERIGLLDQEYLARGRSLGASRLLWEIGAEGTEVRRLRRRLGLDSGYVSRLLRSLESEGLVEVIGDELDQRLRIAVPTPAGRREQHELDRLSDQLATTLIDSLDDRRRQDLLDAMHTVERLLTAGMVTVEVADPRSADAAHCMESYFAELDVRFDDGFDQSLSTSVDYTEFAPPDGLLLIARLRGEPIGCGALKFHGDRPPDVKRMWIDPSARRLGIGRRLLSALEHQAMAGGATVIRLETNRALDQAISLYRAAGYVEVPPFNDEHYAHHWFEKHLPPEEH